MRLFNSSKRPTCKSWVEHCSDRLHSEFCRSLTGIGSWRIPEAQAMDSDCSYRIVVRYLQWGSEAYFASRSLFSIRRMTPTIPKRFGVGNVTDPYATVDSAGLSYFIGDLTTRLKEGGEFANY